MKIWFNGEMVDEAQAKVSVMTHAIHYGSSVFEGIRSYDTPEGARIFRLTDHIERLFYSAGVYRIRMDHERQVLEQACFDALEANGLTAGYIRPIVFRGNCGMGVMPRDMNKVDVAVVAIPWGAYLGEEGLERGVRVCITSWQRLAPNTMPAGVKAGGNYLSSQLIGFEAKDRGYDEGIALGRDGLLSEGAGENLFIVHQGRLMTPPAAASILSGITRDTIMCLARDMGLEVVEQAIARETLYGADEAFMTGTAAEVTPIRQVDHLTLGSGSRGPVTERLQRAFFGLFDGSTADTRGWLQRSALDD